MDTSMTITTPEIALFDRAYLESMVKTFIKTLAQNVQASTDDVPVLSAAELADSCSVDEAEQETLNIVHSYFHQAI